MYVANIQRFSLDDGPGIRTTVFLCGCNMRCIWCHNPEMIRVNEPLGNYNDVNVDYIFQQIIKDKAFYRNNGGVTFSGGEPLLQIEELKVLLEMCKKEGIHTAIETAGNYEENVILQIIDSVDLIMIDCKALSEEIHIRCTGVGNSKILHNIYKLHEVGTNMIIRIPVIPDVNITVDEINQIGKYLGSIGIGRVELMPYHTMGVHKYEMYDMAYKLKQIQSPTQQFKEMCDTQLKKYGIIVDWSR